MQYSNYAFETSDKVCKTSEIQQGFTNQMKLKATVLKLFTLKKQEHKSCSKIQIAQFRSGKQIWRSIHLYLLPAWAEVHQQSSQAFKPPQSPHTYFMDKHADSVPKTPEYSPKQCIFKTGI